MPYNGVGLFVPPSPPTYPAVPGTLIIASYFNTITDDLVSGLSQVITRDGQSAILADLPMGGFKLTGLGAGVGPNDSVRMAQFGSPPAIGNVAPGTGNFTSVTITVTPLAVSSGGTGAATAPAALASLGAQASLVSGANLKTVNSVSLLGAGDVAVQPVLVSATNIKTVNSTSLLGAGDVAVQPVLVSTTNIKSINGVSILGAGDLTVSTGVTNVTVTGTTQTCAVGNSYLLTNAAATACTAPASPANYDKFEVIPGNGLLTNTIDFSTAIVRGPGGDVTGVLTLNPAAPLTFMYSTTLTKWVVL